MRITTSEAVTKLDELMNQTVAGHSPITIAGSRHDAVLISASYWRSMQETLHLLSTPDMLASIKKGVATLLDECEKQLRW